MMMIYPPSVIAYITKGKAYTTPEEFPVIELSVWSRIWRWIVSLFAILLLPIIMSAQVELVPKDFESTRIEVKGFGDAFSVADKILSMVNKEDIRAVDLSKALSKNLDNVKKKAGLLKFLRSEREKGYLDEVEYTALRREVLQLTHVEIKALGLALEKG